MSNIDSRTTIVFYSKHTKVKTSLIVNVTAAPQVSARVSASPLQSQDVGPLLIVNVLMAKMDARK